MPRSRTSPGAATDGPDRLRLGQGIAGRQRHRRRALPAVADAARWSPTSTPRVVTPACATAPRAVTRSTRRPGCSRWAPPYAPASRANLEDHLQTTAGGMRTLVGVTTPGQVLGLGPAWQHIALTLRRSREYDVLADCGRLTPGSPAMAIVDQADAVVLVSRGELEDIAHLRERLRGLQALAAPRLDRRDPDRHRDGRRPRPTPADSPTPSSCWPLPACPSARSASSPRTPRRPTRCAPSPVATSAARCWSARLRPCRRINDLTNLTGRIRQNAS